MRLFLTIILLSVGLTANADYQWFNSPDFWKNTPLDSVLTVSPTQLDTCLIVASNRKMQPDSMRYMLEQRDKGTIRYFFVYVHNGVWHVLPVNSLETAIGYLPYKTRDWLVYTEGMGKTFVGDLDRGIRMAAYYRLNVLLLDYPSINTHKKSLGNYFFATKNANLAYHEFAPVLDTVKQLKLNGDLGPGCFTLFFHSMGNKVMMQLAKDDKTLKPLNDTVWVNNIVLNSACVPQKHHSKWLSKIGFSKAIYVDYNPNDKTLFLAHLVSFRKQLGEKVRKPLAENAYYFNFSNVVGNNHSNFLPLPGHAPTVDEAIAYYQRVLHGNIIMLVNQNKYTPSTYEGIGWDILPWQSTGKGTSTAQK
jgi:hypothetical protein